jgi:hypothetical protein
MLNKTKNLKPLVDLKDKEKLGMVVYTYNPSYSEAEAEGSFEPKSSGPSWATKQDPVS